MTNERRLLLLPFLLTLLLLSSAAHAARLHETWGGPGARGAGAAGSRYETDVTVGDAAGSGTAATLEWIVAGAVAARETLAVPPGGHVRRAAPAALEGRGAFLVRVVSDEPVTLHSETRNRTETGTFGVGASGFRAHETLSAGDVASFDGATASSEPLSHRSNVGLLCLPDAACETALIVTAADGAAVGEGRLAAAPRSAAQEPLATLVPAAAGRDGLRVSFRGLTGRFRPYVVRNDNRTSDGLLVPGRVDRSQGSTFLFPLGCRLGADCWLANYQDRDAGSGVADYAGGALTYDGHDGTDVLVNGFAAMDLGVDVLAAAAGVVGLVVDGNPDRCTGSCTTPENMVLLAHADGSASVYVHLKKGSVLVQQGDVVARGQKIAEVGSSGKSTDPHLHFSWLKRDPVRLVDPFASAEDGWVTPWEDPAPYQGFDGASVVRIALSRSAQPLASWSDDPPVASPAAGETVYAWVRAVRLAPGTRYRLDLVDPAGAAATVEDLSLDAGLAYGEVVVPLVLRGTPGDWEVRAYEGDRLLTRRVFSVR